MIFVKMLADSAFEMSGWIDGDGILHSAPPDVSDFSLQLDGNGGYRFAVTGEDGSKHTGGGERWSLGDGGTILMRCEDWEPDDYLNGAVQTANGPEELFLWYNGGILWCQIVDGGGNWDGYVDTMTELEGNAFAAPQNALLVLYNQYYVDFDAAQFTTYELSDGPGAQYLLATAVVDGTKLWLEEDGFVVGDFGTLDAGESVLLWTGIPEKNGPNLNFIVNGESYYYELNQNNIAFPDHWDYLIG